MKLPKGVTFAESCRIAGWIQHAELAAGKKIDKPKDITPEQITSWLRFYGYKYNDKLKCWTKHKPKPKPKPPRRQEGEE